MQIRKKGTPLCGHNLMPGPMAWQGGFKLDSSPYSWSCLVGTWCSEQPEQPYTDVLGEEPRVAAALKGEGSM